MDLNRLKDKFPEKDIEWRVQSAGRNSNGEWALVLAYVTNRAIMDRLDEVCGPESWSNEFEKGPDGGVICGISIKVARGSDGNGEHEWSRWVTKWDGAENSDIESVKGGLSNSMKRAGVQWGIGRYLYNLPVTFAKISDHGKNKAKYKDKDGSEHWFKWDPPDLPNEFLPEPREQDEGDLRDAKNTTRQYLEDNKAVIGMDVVDPWYLDIDTTDSIDRIREIYKQAKAIVKKYELAQLKDNIIETFEGDDITEDYKNKKAQDVDEEGFF